MNYYMPQNFDEILVHPKDKLSILHFFISIINFNNDPILCKELQIACNSKENEDILKLKNVCVILGAPGSGKTTLIKYICQKLNMRECYYESESQENINFIRNMKNADGDNSYYYHPYNEFLLYSSCQIGNNKKPKTKNEKKYEQAKIIDDKIYEGIPENNRDNGQLNEHNGMDFEGTSGNNNKRKYIDKEEISNLNKIAKLGVEKSDTNMQELNILLSNSNENRNNSSCNDGVKKVIIDELTEYNILNGKSTKMLLKMYNTFINILETSIKSVECKDGKEELLLPFSLMSNSYYKNIDKNYKLINTIWKKIQSVLAFSYTFRTNFLQNSEKSNNIEKKNIIDLFVDSNYHEYVIKNLNELNKIHENINVNFLESNTINKLIIENLKIANHLMTENRGNLFLANTLKEDVICYMKKKNIKKKIEDSLFRKYYFEKKQNINVDIERIYQSFSFLSNFKEEYKWNSNILLNNSINREIKNFIDFHNSREVIKWLIVDESHNNSLINYTTIINSLNERKSCLNVLKSLEQEHGIDNLMEFPNPHPNLQVKCDINKYVDEIIENMNYSDNNMLELIFINNINNNLINNMNLNISINELINCNEFITNYLTDITIINYLIVKYLKEESVNSFIKVNSSNKRMDKENYELFEWLQRGEEIKYSANENNTGQKIPACLNSSSLYTYNDFISFNKRKEKTFSHSQNISKKKEKTDIHSKNVDTSKDGLHFISEKVREKIINYSKEIYTINKRIMLGLNKYNELIENTMFLLKKEYVIKKKLLIDIFECLETNDNIMNWLVPKDFKKTINNIILNSNLYRHFININLKSKKEYDKKKNYYDNHYINTRAIIIDELPLSELEYSEDFRKSCVNSIQFVFNRVISCKKEYSKYINEDRKNQKNRECYCIHPIIIFINSFEKIKTINTLLGVDINYSPFVNFIKLKKIHPLYLEKALSERYYCKMINLNKNIKEVIKNISYNCNGDIRSCFNSLDFINRIPDLNKMSFEQIMDVSVLCQNDIFTFAKNVLCGKIYSKNRISHNSNSNIDLEFHLNSNINNEPIFRNDNGDTSAYNNAKPSVMENEKKKKKWSIYKELDEKADMMNVSEKFQVLSILKENFIFFYNNLYDIAKLFSNLSTIDYSFRGVDCSNNLMRKTYDNKNHDTTKFINEHFSLTYRYYIMCNRKNNHLMQNGYLSDGIEMLDIVEKVNNSSAITSIESLGKTNLDNTVNQNSFLVKTFFSLKTNYMNKYYHHFSIARKKLYDRYIMIVIRKLINQNINTDENITEKYGFFLRGNYELFSSVLPSYILLIIKYWNSIYKNGSSNIMMNNIISEENAVLENYEEKNNLETNEHNSINNNDDTIIDQNEINKPYGFYFNEYCEMLYDFNPNSIKDKKRYDHMMEVISFAETFITPKFIALFFPSYLKYLKNGTKQKQNVINLVGNQAVSKETYFEMIKLLRMHDMELYNYFFYY
ncbi:hypothetical protein YYG_03764 [Plasmodium vinckei petteri]|uniref:Uncharacterized protein n=1 Tax=Plasmodium vinckei petteri TaxID=138298 RepID=W7B061_PLAVN|nr:hypothetical protein YYG_03764 [Plasmodium vinckei petteri]CAD2099806.1 conserved Plasmodium protein, unknown function [Plasmodium vinckei petteri]